MQFRGFLKSEKWSLLVSRKQTVIVWYETLLRKVMTSLRELGTISKVFQRINSTSSNDHKSYWVCEACKVKVLDWVRDKQPVYSCISYAQWSICEMWMRKLKMRRISGVNQNQSFTETSSNKNSTFYVVGFTS